MESGKPVAACTKHCNKQLNLFSPFCSSALVVEWVVEQDHLSSLTPPLLLIQRQQVVRNYNPNSQLSFDCPWPAAVLYMLKRPRSTVPGCVR